MKKYQVQPVRDRESWITEYVKEREIVQIRLKCIQGGKIGQCENTCNFGIILTKCEMHDECTRVEIPDEWICNIPRDDESGKICRGDIFDRMAVTVCT